MNKNMVKCRCGEEVDVMKAPWCKHDIVKTKLCPNGHCICHLLDNDEKWRPATVEEKKHGFGFMLKEEFGGVKE